MLEPAYGQVGKNPPAGRTYGVVMHPTSLPGPHGTGDLSTSCFEFVDWLASAGCRAWQVRPPPALHPNSLRLSCPSLTRTEWSLKPLSNPFLMDGSFNPSQTPLLIDRTLKSLSSGFLHSLACHCLGRDARSHNSVVLLLEFAELAKPVEMPRLCCNSHNSVNDERTPVSSQQAKLLQRRDLIISKQL